MTEQEGAEALLTFMRDKFILPASYEECWEGIMFQNIFPCMLTSQFVVGIYPAEAVIKIRVTNHQMGEGTIDDKICRRLIDNRTVDDNAICTLLINNIPNGFLRMRFIRDIHERHGIAVTCKLCENAAHDIEHMRIGISFSFFEFSQIYNISGIATCKIDSAGIGSVLEFSGSGFYSFGRFFGNCFPMIHYFRYSGYGYAGFFGDIANGNSHEVSPPFWYIVRKSEALWLYIPRF